MPCTLVHHNGRLYLNEFSFDEEIKVSKLRTVMPQSVYTFIALEAHARSIVIWCSWSRHKSWTR